MPISYSCPHCGKHYSVAEQYAGQTGPCASCGKSITIPLASMGGAYVPPPSSSGGGIAVVIIAIAVVVLVCPGILIALLLPALQAARESARRMQSSNNLRQIGIAMHNYHDTYRSFPPAVVTDASGKPLYSGRVLLLPFMEQMPLYDAWDKNAAWDSPQNLSLSQTVISTFQDPSHPARSVEGQTDYLFVTGTNTMFDVPAGQQLDFSQITDGTSNTMMAIEVKNSGISWAEPRDVDMSAPTPLPPSSHPSGNVVLFADGAVHNIPSGTPPPQVRAMATRNGNEPVAIP